MFIHYDSIFLSFNLDDTLFPLQNRNSIFFVSVFRQQVVGNAFVTMLLLYFLVLA